MKKDESEEGPDFEVANISIHRKSSAISMARKYIPRRDAKPTGFAPLFWRTWSLPAPKTRAVAALQKNVGLSPWFLRVTR